VPGESHTSDSPNSCDLFLSPLTWSFAMLHYAVVFFVIAVIAALFGFGGIAAGAVGIAKILFFVFVVLAIVSLLFGTLRKR
jgi:uncharacterized membrane protein YtjA (UPF0391 family)